MTFELCNLKDTHKLHNLEDTIKLCDWKLFYIKINLEDATWLHNFKKNYKK